MDFTFDICDKTRTIFIAMLETTPLKILNKKPTNFNNTIFWNIKHVVVTQQLLIYGLSNLPMCLTEKEIKEFRKGSKYKKDATLEEVELLKQQLRSTLQQTKKDYKNGLFKTYNEYQVSTTSVLSNIEEALLFNNFHEGIHLGYILAMKRSN